MGTRYKIIVCLVLTCTSCMSEVLEIENVQGTRIFIEGLLVQGADTTFIDILPAYPFNHKKKNTFENLYVELSINGNEVTVESADGKCWYSTARVSTGDHVSIKVRDSACEEAFAETVVPGKTGFDVHRSIQGGRIVNLFDLGTNNEEEVYYGILAQGNIVTSVFKDGTIQSVRKDKMNLSLKTYSPGETPISIDEEITGLSHTVVKQFHNGDFVVFKSSEANPQYVLETTFLRDRRSYISEKEYVDRTCEFKFDVLKLDESAYKYFNPQVNYNMLSAGLIPPFASSGNIYNGYGLFYAPMAASTGWLSNLSE